MSYIQLIASINSGVSVSVSFHAIISRLTLLQVAVLQLATVIQFESGFDVSITGSVVSVHVVVG